MLLYVLLVLISFIQHAQTRAVMEEVVLLEQPQSGHVVKSRPYHLSCRAVNAKKIRYKCNNKWLEESRIENLLGTDPSSQLPYLESSVDITRQEVDTSLHMDDFTCYCYATGNSDEQAIRSDPAKIKVAYMRKHFIQSPSSERVAEGSTVQLPCTPPESDPKSEITWQKDGVDILRSADSNIIYASDGSLIISSARLTDSGNYTCEANNVANRRATDPAILNVYVNGGWSEWSPFSGTCQVDCNVLSHQLAASTSDDVIPRLRRTRTCNNPAPLNGGAYCSGPEEDLRPCDLPCRIDGRWSPWTEWSACSPTCHRFRTRTCSAPSPSNGGKSCQGRDLDTLPCAEDYCMPASQASMNNDVALYGGLACVMLLLLVIMALCAALLCKKNKAKKTTPNNIYYAETGAHVRRVQMERKALLGDECSKMIPHGSQMFSTCSPSPLHPSMTMRSGKSAYSGYSANRNAGSRAALITECSSNSSSGGKMTLVRTSSNCSEEDHYETLYDLMDEKTATGLESSQASLAAQVDAGGARFQLKRSGAALLIPENAIETERMIYLAVSDQLTDRPELLPNQSALSPVVEVGECESSKNPNDVLLKPLVLSFRHCASVFPKDNWVFSVYANYGFGWRQEVTIGEEDLNTAMHVHMESPGKSRDGSGWVHVMMEAFARVILVGRPRRPSVSACKRVHLAAFGPSLRPSNSFEIRVYCVPETGAAMESVNRQEEQGRLLDESSDFLLNERGELCFCVEDIADGFNMRGPPLVEIADTQHQWCAQNGLHCPLTFMVDGGVSVEDFFARIVVFQKTNNAERHVLQARFENCLYDKPPVEEDKMIVSFDFNLPAVVKYELSELLDPATDTERDWRGLAKKLHLDKYINYFGTHPGRSPTSLLLDLWEASEWGSARAPHDLLQSLRVMGRPDAVLLLEQFLSSHYYSST